MGYRTCRCYGHHLALPSFPARRSSDLTHVGRVATRLALLREGAGSDEQHDELTRLTPPGEELELHINLLRHGRRTCHARRSEEHTSELQSQSNLVCRLLHEKKK